MVQLNHGYLGCRHFALGGYSTWPGTNYLEPQASEKIVDHLVEMAREFEPSRDQRFDLSMAAAPLSAIASSSSHSFDEIES